MGELGLPEDGISRIVGWASFGFKESVFGEGR